MPFPMDPNMMAPPGGSIPADPRMIGMPPPEVQDSVDMEEVAAEPDNDKLESDFQELAWTELRESEEVMSQVRAWSLEHYKAYRLSADLDEIPYDESVRLPLSRSATVDRVSRYAGPFVTSENPITVRAMEGTSPQAAEAQEGFLNRQWHSPYYINGREMLLKMLKIADMAGVAWCFIDWVKEAKTFDAEQSERDPVTGQTNKVNYPENIDLDGPQVKIIHPYDGWPDPRADHITRGRYAHVREELSFGEFKDRVAQGYYTGKAAEEIIKSGGSAFSTAALGITTDSRYELPISASLAAPSWSGGGTEPKYRTVFVWHRFDSESWITYDPLGRILRVAPNPSPDGRMPVRGLILDPDLQGPIGIPPAEGAHGMNRVANRLASGVMEHLARIVNPTLGIRQDAVDLAGAADISGAPFEMLVLPDQDAIFPIRKTDGTLPTAMDGVSAFKYWGDIGGGTSDYRKGVSDAGTPKTATGTQAFLQQADSKFAISFALVSDFMRDLVGTIGLYNQQFLEKPQWIYRIGRNGVNALTCQVGRPMIQGNFEYNTTASAARADPATHGQSVLALVNVFGATGMMDLGYTGRYCAELFGVKSPELMFPGYVPPPMPIEDEIELIRMGLMAPVNPGDDHMAHIDAYAAAAQAATVRAAQGDPAAQGEADRFVQHVQAHIAFITQMMQAKSGGQDVGNSDGEKADDKGGGSDKKGSGPDGGKGPDGGSPGPNGPGRDGSGGGR